MTAGRGVVVVGIGQDVAGDDGVGLAVARVLGARGAAVRESADASILLSLVEEGRRVVVIDAVVGGAPGSVMRLDARALASGPAPLSSHGIGVAEALELARTLYGEGAVARVEIVGVAIDRPAAGARIGLSPAVAAAVEPAAVLAASLVVGE